MRKRTSLKWRSARVPVALTGQIEGWMSRGLRGIPRGLIIRHRERERQNHLRQGERAKSSGASDPPRAESCRKRSP